MVHFIISTVSGLHFVQNGPNTIEIYDAWFMHFFGFIWTNCWILDVQASSSSLYMPEPEDAVAHGDANLAVNDFLTRTSL